VRASFIQCSLTLHSRGGPTACHQAWATGCGGPFSVAQAWRPTVGLPLSSNVRRHIPTMQYASVLIQILRPVCTSFLRGQCPASVHTLRQGPMQIRLLPALRRSRPSAFAVPGVACVHSPIGHGQAKQSLVVFATRRALGAVRSPSVRSQPAWRCGRQFFGCVSRSFGACR
jgi:hypothetical protein